MKNTHGMMAICLLTAAVLLAGCSSSKTEETDKTSEQETFQTEAAASESETAPETEASVDYTNLVTDILNEQFEVTVYGTQSECHYIIPVINWDGDEIASLNNRIYEKYSAYYTAAKDNGESGWQNCDQCSYTWSVTDDILTLIMSASLYPDASGWTEPEVFSVDLKENRILDKNDIMTYYHLTQEAYNQKVKDAMGNQFCHLYGAPFDNDSSFFYDSFTQNQLERTVSQDNIDFAVPYINEDGHFSIRARIYSLAAGDSYPYLIDVETTDPSKWYAEYTGTDPEDYIIADSASKYLEASDIAGLTSDQIQMAINEIYARHGRKFKDDEVRAYFESKSWYKGTVEPEQFDSSVFNEYEEENLKYLLAHK